MITVFEYNEYREFIHARFQEMPKQGHGQAFKLSQFLGVHSTLISQILRGIKTFTLEQAAQTTEYLGLNDLETDYFLLLVQMDRAGNESLRSKLRRQLKGLAEKAEKLTNRLKPQHKISEEIQSTFYSDWVYSAVRLMIAIEDCQTIDGLSNRLGLPVKMVRKIVSFLLQNGLCKEEKGKIKTVSNSTHLESTSPWVRIHHFNWRQKALENLNDGDPVRLHYTCPLTMSQSDARRLRELIVNFINRTDKIIEPSPSEALFCLNIDWFRIA